MPCYTSTGLYNNVFTHPVTCKSFVYLQYIFGRWPMISMVISAKPSINMKKYGKYGFTTTTLPKKISKWQTETKSFQTIGDDRRGSAFRPFRARHFGLPLRIGREPHYQVEAAGRFISPHFQLSRICASLECHFCSTSFILISGLPLCMARLLRFRKISPHPYPSKEVG